MKISAYRKRNFFKCAVDLKIYSNSKNLKNYLSFFFNYIDLRGKHVLDVGGGAGLLSYWIAVNGGSAICLEPEFDGSTKGKSIFKEFGQNLEMDRSEVEFKVSTFQDYLPQTKFDIIILANSINHLNESAVQEIQFNKLARDLYTQYLEKMYEMLNENGTVIITDCSRYNFFNLLGLKSPLMPTIEWTKHQSPFAWKELLKNVGFKETKIQWSSPNSLGFLGKLIFANSISSYFTLSHFRIEARK